VGVGSIIELVGGRCVALGGVSSRIHEWVVLVVFVVCLVGVGEAT